MSSFTAWLCTGIVSVTTGVLLCVQFLTNRSERAMYLWGLGGLLAGCGAAFLGMRGAIPDVWSIVFANGLVVLGWSLLTAGFVSFNGRRVRLVALVLPAATVAVLLAVALAVRASPTFWALISGGAVTVIIVQAVVSCRRAQRREFLLWRRIALVVLGSWTVVMLTRTVAAVIAPSSADPAVDSRMQVISAMCLMALAVAVGVAVLMMSRERIDRQLSAAAHRDPQTGALNRAGLADRYAELVRSGRPFTVALVDLDEFKTVNDRYGHAVGDLLVSRFVAVALGRLGPDDVLARYGGDEFCVLITDTSPARIQALADSIRREFAVPVAVPESAEPVTVTVSIGIGVVPAHRKSLDADIADADVALYRAKSGGRNRLAYAPAGDQIQ